MKCPVCKTNIDINTKVCPICGFNKLHVEFLTPADAVDWTENVVLPYRNQWMSITNTKKPTDLYQEMVGKMLESAIQLENTTDNRHVFDFCVDDGEIVLTKYLEYGMNEVISIPERINGFNVVTLGDALFKGCQEIKSVQLPSSVRRIGSHAFENSGLKTINMPYGITHIGENSFSRSKLQQIDLPNSLISVGVGAFQGTLLSTIVFPESIKVIPDDVCRDCSSLITAIILGAKTCSTYAFGNCRKLLKLALPETLEEISRGVQTGNQNHFQGFDLCFKLQDGATLVLPKSLQRIYIDSDPPATNVVILNDRLQWIGRKGTEDYDMCDDVTPSSGFNGFSDDLDGVFREFFGGRKHFIFYCNVGSTSHVLARKKGYSVKPLSSVALSDL